MKNTKLLVKKFIPIVLLSIGIYLTQFFSCKKDSPSLEDRNIFNPPSGNYYSVLFCKINDSDWCDCSISPGGIAGWKYSGAEAQYYKNNSVQSLSIQALNGCGTPTNYPSFGINIKPFNGKGTYILSDPLSGNSASGILQIGTKTGRIYRTKSNYNGMVYITDFDTIQRTISGTFFFEALYDDSNQTIKIRDGIFTKLKYN